jgi:hypothetical protein
MPRLPRVRLVCYASRMAERNETAAAAQHPLAVTRTELVWEGKYDGAGILGNDTTKTVKVKVK